MINLYSVEFEQFNRDGVPYNSDKQEVMATTAERAIQKARRLARQNGFLKSQPIAVKSLDVLARNLK